MRSTGAAVVALVALLAVPASAARAPTPGISAVRAGTFAVQLVRWMGDDRYDLAWRMLLPLHQQAAPEPRYVACELLTPLPTIAKVEVVRITAAWVTVSGLPEPVAGRRVRLRTTFTSGGTSLAVLHTVHVVAAYGRPAWILPPARYAAYNAGSCPAYETGAR